MSFSSGTSSAVIWTKKEALFKRLKNSHGILLNLDSSHPEDFDAFFTTINIDASILTVCASTGEKIDFIPVYNFNYEKIRNIVASGTNRFNLLQTLAESFECWCKFEIKHKNNGEVMLTKDAMQFIVYDGGNSESQNTSRLDGGGSGNVSNSIIIDANYSIKDLYRPLKFITFHKNVGQINNVDLIYGINLKSINRSIESNNLVTKLIVGINNNKYAEGGGCDISRAKENPTNGNLLYNFKQYVS